MPHPLLDLQLPHPLLNPTQWAALGAALGPREGVPLFSISHFKFGGPFAQRRQAWIQDSQATTESLPLALSVPAHFWLRDAVDEPSFVALLQTEFEAIPIEIEIVSRLHLDRGEQIAWRDLAARSGRDLHFRTEPELRLPTLLEWSKEVFPDSYAAAGDVPWHRELKNYEEQMKAASPSMDQLRFWAGYLKSKSLAFAPTAALEWACAQVLFSPQDDRRGVGPTALLNPTLQVVMDQEKPTALWRVDDKVISRDLTWESAAVIDELRETPRVLLDHLQAEMNAKRLPLKATRAFEDVIQDMVRDGAILLRS